MKKIIMFLLFALLIFGVSGCSKISEEQDVSPKKSEQSDTKVQQVDPFSDEGMVLDSTDEPEEESEAPPFE